MKTHIHRSGPSELVHRVSSLASLLLVALALAIFATPAFSQTTEVPERVSYQGIVTDKLGNLLAPTDPGNYEVVFRVWDSPTGGTTPVYSEKQTITIFKGEFSALVGAGADVTGEEASGPSNVSIAEVFDDASRYLGVTVASAPATPVSGSDPEITPRQQIVTTPFAFRSAVAEQVGPGGVNTDAISDGSITLSKLGTGSVNGSKIADGSIGTADLASGSVTTGILAGNSVINSAIVNGAVTASKLGSDVGLWSVVGGDVYRSSGNVGIGTPTPSRKLHVYNGSSGNPIHPGAAGVFESNGNTTYLQLNSPNNTWAGILFGRSGNHGDGSIIYTPERDLSFNTNNQGLRMVIKADGKVGIGTTSPITALDVKGDGVNISAPTSTDSLAFSLIADGTKRGYFGLAGTAGSFSSSAADGDVVLRADSGKLHLLTGTAAATMTISGTHVGIGTTSPVKKLHVYNGSSGNPVYPTSVAVLEGNVDTYLQINVPDNRRAGILFGRDGYNAAGEISYTPAEDLWFYTGGGFRMTITESGRMGIGTTSPTAPLHVATTTNLTSSPSAYLVSSGPQWNQNSSLTLPYSIYASGNTIASGHFVHSDERIKDVRGVSNAFDDLDTLNSIEIVDYHLKDRVMAGGQTVKKVVAQQVERVFPQAVSQTTDVVPDIYQKGVSADGWVRCATDLNVGEQVRIISDEGPALHEVVETGEDRFRVAEALPDGDVFVYGRQVDDFRVVDYEAIAMLNVSATQELARENAALKKRLAELEAKERARDAKLVAIEALLKSAAKPAVQTAALKSDAQ